MADRLHEEALSEVLRAAMAMGEQEKKVVAAISGLVGAVQTLFEDDPSRMREALGYSEPGGRSKSAPQDKAAKTTKPAKDGRKGKDAKEGPADKAPAGEGEESGEE